MSSAELLSVTLLFLITVIAYVGLGARIISWVHKLLKVTQAKEQRIENIGINLAVGLTGFGYIALVLGLAGQFTQLNLATALIISLLWGIPKIKLPKFGTKWDIFSVIVTLMSLAMLATLYLAAMQPPHTSDELNYHFPQAVEIVKSKRIDLAFGGHYFYGNIPKQMEILFASGIALSGYSYAHTLHFMYFLAFLLIVFGFLLRLYGIRAASLAVFALLMYDDLTWNVTSGFVDGAAFVLEISALLLATTSLKNKNRESYFVSIGLLLGAGLSIKYSVGFTALYIAIITLPYYKQWLYLALPGLLMGGFWYAKNLIWFGNPFYPLYLGHKGVTGSEYNSLVANIQQFGPKTATYFIKLISYFKEIPRAPVYVALLASPLSILFREKRRTMLILFAYMALYLAYWFFLGTHQLRFIAPAVIAALILLAILLSKVPAKLVIAIFVVINLVLWRTPYFEQTVFSYFWSTKFHLTERQYALGNLTQDEFMYRWYGCYYSAVEYMNETDYRDVVADNWSQGIEFNVPFYSTMATFKNSLNKDNKYMYTRDSTKSSFQFRFPTASIAILEYEKWYVRSSELAWSRDDCKIYKLR